jgi:hypothetical protein
VEQPEPAPRRGKSQWAFFVAAFVLTTLAAPAPAQDLGTETPQWREIEAALPAYPRAENLVPFSGGPASTHQFFVDAPSLSVGADGVVRYTLVIKTSGGATNVTHEGIRCDERRHKTYAIGQASGSWARARDPQWRYIEYRTVNNHQRVLHNEYLCAGRDPVKTPKEIVQLLRRPPERSITGD